jgi:hypothetical protein
MTDPPLTMRSRPVRCCCLRMGKKEHGLPRGPDLARTEQALAFALVVRCGRAARFNGPRPKTQEVGVGGRRGKERAESWAWPDNKENRPKKNRLAARKKVLFTI